MYSCAGNRTPSVPGSQWVAVPSWDLVIEQGRDKDWRFDTLSQQSTYGKGSLFKRLFKANLRWIMDIMELAKHEFMKS